MTFSIDNEVVYYLNIKLDNVDPNFNAYIDVSRFMGKTIDVTVVPNMGIEYKQSNEMKIDKVYSETMRPQIHFSTKNGWLNDPNGLIYISGVYHMFYQHNPADTDWDNMHWGHALSKDLIHWEEKDIALFPDKNGAKYSGCAILDKNNLLGVQNGDNLTVVLFYTATKPYSQRIAYSVDNFNTITELKENPIVTKIVEGNRDPKVVFCQEINCYIMVLYLENEKYCIFCSKDLIKWNKIQEIEICGDNECPDIFPLKDKNGEQKWVLIGAHDKYIVGDFKNKLFVPIQSQKTLHYGNSAYAGQTFSNMPNDRNVRMVWDRFELKTHPFNGQMGVPMEFTLEEVNSTWFLCAEPVKEISSLYKSNYQTSEIIIQKEDMFISELEDAPYLFKIKGQFLKDKMLEIKFFGVKLGIDFSKNIIKFLNYTMPILVAGNLLDIIIIIDRCSVEIFSDGGKSYMTVIDKQTVCDRNLTSFSITTTDKYKLDAIEIHSLNSIWQN